MMNFTGSPARKGGVQSQPQSIQSPLSRRSSIQSPGGGTRKKNTTREEGITRAKVGSASPSRENCNPNFRVKSPSGCQKSRGFPSQSQSQSPLTRRSSLQSPGIRRENITHEGNVVDKVGSTSPSRENCDSNFGVKSPSGCLRSKGGVDSCKLRRCAAIYSDWGCGGRAHQQQQQQTTRKFVVAKRHDRVQQEGVVCNKCCERRKSGGGGKCACVASEKLRVSQEEFVRKNFKKEKREPAECDGEKFQEVGCGGSGSEQGPVGCDGIQRGRKGCSEMDEDEKTGVSGAESGGMHECINCSEEGFDGFEVGGTCGISETKDNQCGNESDDSAGKIGVFGPQTGSVGEMIHGAKEGFKGFELGSTSGFFGNGDNRCGSEFGGNGNLDEKMHCFEKGFKGSELAKCDELSISPRASPAPRRPRNELLAEAIGSIPQQGGGRVKHLVKAFESLLSIPDFDSTEGYEAGPLDRSIYNVSDADQGRREIGARKGVKWALPGMQSKGSIEKPYRYDSLAHESWGDVARPLDRSMFDVSDVDQRKQEVSVHRVLKWGLPGMKEEDPNRNDSTYHESYRDLNQENSVCLSEASFADFRSSSNPFVGDFKRMNNISPSHGSCDDSKFLPSEDTASVGNNDTHSASSNARSQSSAGSRRSRKQSLDSSGRGSLGRNAMYQWKKQLKVTSARPFKLRTEQRGHAKEKEFMKKVQEMLAEEEKGRIPIAQGLPYTTDEPECLVKPPVKEITKPLDVKLYTEIRAVDRAEFDQIIAEKLNALEQQRLEEERLQKLAEEEEIKRMRKEMVPRAQPMPFFDRPFIPKRSSKSPTVPREPKFHVPHHKRAKCISWNDFNVCQQ